MKNKLTFLLLLITHLGFSQTKGFRIFEVDGDFGLLNHQCEVVIQPEYKSLFFYNDSLVMVDNGYCFFLNLKGMRVSNEVYSVPLPTKNGYWKVFYQQYSMHEDPNITEGVYAPYADFSEESIKSDDGWGFDGESGGGVYDKFKAIRYQLENNGFAILAKNGKTAVLDKQGKELPNLKSDQIERIALSHTKAVYRVKTAEKYGLLDEHLKEILPPTFDYLAVFELTNEMPIIITGMKINTASRLFTEDWNFEQADINAITDKVYTLYNTQGKPISNSYNMVASNHNFDDEEALIKVQKGKLYGLIDHTGKEVLPCEYQCIVVYEKDNSLIYKVCKNNLWGFLDKNLHAEIPIEYERLGIFNYYSQIGWCALAQKNGKYGVISYQNKPILPFDYTYLSHFQGDKFLYHDGNSYQVINLKGEKSPFQGNVNWQ